MKSCYSSGFLYHPGSRQVLLLQENKKDDAFWTLLTCEGKDPDACLKSFKDLVQKLLKLKLKVEAVYPVYNYYHPELKKDNYVFYAEVSKLQEFPSNKKVNFAWFAPQEISKVPLSPQTKQDIVVGQRVIESKMRRAAGEQTID